MMHAVIIQSVARMSVISRKLEMVTRGPLVELTWNDPHVRAKKTSAILSRIETSGPSGQYNVKTGGPNWSDSFKTRIGPVALSSPDFILTSHLRQN